MHGTGIDAFVRTVLPGLVGTRFDGRREHRSVGQDQRRPNVDEPTWLCLRVSGMIGAQRNECALLRGAGAQG